MKRYMYHEHGPTDTTVIITEEEIIGSMIAMYKGHNKDYPGDSKAVEEFVEVNLCVECTY